jgi:hypothetical protein
VHVHCLVTGGAVASDGTRWIRGRGSFLFPVKALAVVFRAKYLAGLQRAFEAGTLTFAAGTAPPADAARFAALLAQLRATPWPRLLAGGRDLPRAHASSRPWRLEPLLTSCQRPPRE